MPTPAIASRGARQRQATRKETVMKTTTQRIRNAAFYAQLATFVGMIAFFLNIFRLPGLSFTQNYDVLSTVFGALGVPVLWLTFRAKEVVLQKLFFILAGVAGVGVFVTLAVFTLLSWAGHKPGGDGGGITVLMLVVVCPIAFLIGAVGSVVYLIKGAIAEKRNTP